MIDLSFVLKISNKISKTKMVSYGSPYETESLFEIFFGTCYKKKVKKVVKS